MKPTFLPGDLVSINEFLYFVVKLDEKTMKHHFQYAKLLTPDGTMDGWIKRNELFFRAEQERVKK